MNYQKIEKIVNAVLEEENAFLVSIVLTSANNITVKADSFEGLNFKRLKMINRKVEALLDREVEDFSLMVSSPGLDQAFKVHNQYLLNVDRTIKVVTHENETVIGKLTAVTDDDITLQTIASKKVKSETVVIAFADVLETKVEIQFK